MPTFHANILKQYVDVFNEGAIKLVHNVQKEVGKEEFDIQNYFYNNMLSTLLGKNNIVFLSFYNYESFIITCTHFLYL